MFLLIYQSKLKKEPKDGLANGWRWNVQKFETVTGARVVKHCMEQECPDCTVEYIDITIAETLE